MNCTVADYNTIKWISWTNPMFFIFNIVAVLSGIILRWIWRSFNTNLPDVNKNIMTFLNAYIIEFLNGAIIIAVSS